jgi:hypothetical protein
LKIKREKEEEEVRVRREQQSQKEGIRKIKKRNSQLRRKGGLE